MNNHDRDQHDRFLHHFMKHEESLRVFVRSLLFSREEEREVMQEVAAVLWRKFDPEMDDTAFVRWAFGVARMETLAFRRDRARDRLRFGDEVTDLLATSVQQHAESLERERQALDRCLEKLPAEQRTLVQAAYAPGTRIDALAEKLNRSAMSLYKTLHRIRLALLDCTRKTLAQEEQG